MSDKKISALTGASTPLTGTEVLPIVQGGATVKVAVSDLTAARPINASTIALGTTSAIPTTNTVLYVTSSSIANPAVYLDGYINGNNCPVLYTRKAQGTIAAPTSVGTGANTFSYRSQAYDGTTYRTATVMTGVVDVFNTTDDLSSAVVISTRATGVGSVTAERMRIGSTLLNINTPVYIVGDTTFSAGNLIPSTAAKGINFTANTPAAGMTSQLLNWYEEGTWDATLTADSGTITAGTYFQGKYVRVGRQVTVSNFIQVSAVSSPSGALFINGLPFANNSDLKNRTAATIWANNLTTLAITSMMAYVPDSVSKISVSRFNAGLNVDDVAGYVQVGTRLYISATYFIS